MKTFFLNLNYCFILCRFNQNYGVLGVLDRLHGTDNQFRASKAYERHFLLLGFTPMLQQFPEPEKKTCKAE
jgi:methylsterol monooxygenase